MPRIVRFHELGGPEVLKIEEMPARRPGRGEVVIDVKAMGLNRAEAMFMHGQYLEPTRLPASLGYEASGTVTAVGPDVDPTWLDKDVSTIPSFSPNQYGVLGEEVTVPVEAIAEYPERLQPTEATSIWMQYLTAYGALIDIGHLRKGDFVLITAASSSAGLAAIQTTKAEQANAIATTRKRGKRDELLAAGADHVIVTEEEDLVARVHDITNGTGARIIFDPIAGPMLEQLAEAAADKGMIFEYGYLSHAPTPFPVVPALTKTLTVHGYWVAEILSDPERAAKAKAYVYKQLQEGRFTPSIAKTFRFEDIKKAYEYMESNEQIGKIVVTTGQ
jgi:NADPH:quinone reductase-like Zn-dependent oxidoreductase